MEIEDAIFAQLSTATALTNIVGDRIYPIRVNQGAGTPCIAFSAHVVDVNVPLSERAGLFSSILSFDSWAKTSAQSRAVSQAIRDALEGFSGTVVTVRIDSIRFVYKETFYDPDSELFRTVLELRAMHN